MDILVLGGTGFISSYLVQILEENHNVTVFNRGKHESVLPLPDNVDLVTGDRNNRKDLNRLIKNNKYDAVYDMIAYTPEQSQLAIDVFKGNIGRFIHCSTVSVYMVLNSLSCPITEEQDKGQLMDYFPRNPFGMDYGINKRKCEKVLWEAHHNSDILVTVLRPTFVSGPGDPTMRDWFWIDRILDGQPLLVPGSGDFAFQQVFVNDVASAFAKLIENQETIGKAYNVASEEIYTLNTYLKKIGELLNKEPEIIHIDQNLFDNYPISQSNQGDVFPFNTRRTAIFSLNKIKNDLNYHSTPFQDWMQPTIAYYNKKSFPHSIGYKHRSKEINLAKTWQKKYNQIMKVNDENS
ncbi:MAG: SDR family oxidoreductase [Candidatus Marinimicrobia bacterium]|nr:SDR family oxidoreductase [Candidatus Neomarinimicrobiota bacterium]